MQSLARSATSRLRPSDKADSDRQDQIPNIVEPMITTRTGPESRSSAHCPLDAGRTIAAWKAVKLSMSMSTTPIRAISNFGTG
jgi:hypothetical protein